MLHKDTGRISRHAVLMLHAGDIKVVAVVGVAGRKMSAKHGDLQIWIFSGFDTHGTHLHSSSLNIHSACRDDLDVRVGLFSCFLRLMSLRGAYLSILVSTVTSNSVPARGHPPEHLRLPPGPAPSVPHQAAERRPPRSAAGQCRRRDRHPCRRYRGRISARR